MTQQETTGMTVADCGKHHNAQVTALAIRKAIAREKPRARA